MQMPVLKTKSKASDGFRLVRGFVMREMAMDDARRVELLPGIGGRCDKPLLYDPARQGAFSAT